MTSKFPYRLTSAQHPHRIHQVYATMADAIEDARWIVQNCSGWEEGIYVEALQDDGTWTRTQRTTYVEPVEV